MTTTPQPDGRSYLPAPTESCPTFDDSEWHPFVDGASYYTELDERLAELVPGDSVLIAGFEFEARVDLRGRRPGEEGYTSLGERLACLSADGVDVRVVLAGQRVAAILPVPAMHGFRRNATVTRRLQRWRPHGVTRNGDAPLRGRVLLDKSGPLLGSNHLKSVALVHRGQVTAFVGGIDLTLQRFDRSPHDTQRVHGRRWGWHDAAVRLRGPAAGRVHDVLADRWTTAARRRERRRVLLIGRPLPESSPVPTIPRQAAMSRPGSAIRVLRSSPPRRFLTRRTPPVHEVFETITAAIDAAKRYIYLEDQYLQEQAGGDSDYELYPYLRAAAARGVKIILVGSGVRDSADPGLHLRQINRSLNRDLQRKLVDRLDVAARENVAVFRVRRVTVHAKVLLIDDVFACVGSANMFSRSMSGTDRELSAAVGTTTSVVRDLRVQLWAEHLRTAVSDTLRPSIENLDTALGIWQSSWSAEPVTCWREPGRPAGFAPAEQALVRVPGRGARRPWRRRPTRR